MKISISQPPPILYKYLGPKGVRLLTSTAFRFTSPLELNDPFESRLPTVTRAQSPSAARRAPIFPQDQELLLEAVGATYGVTCFSEAHDNLLMWAHYAAAHSGFAVGFETEHERFADLGRLAQIQYHARRPVLRSLTLEEAVLRMLTTKSRDWKYEREWRLIRKLETCVSSGGLYLGPFDPECIKVVILGARASRTLKQRVVKWHAEYPQVELRQARLDSLRFSLSLDTNLASDPAVIIGAKRHGPVAFDVSFAAELEMRDGTFFVRDITPEIIPDERTRRAVQRQVPRTTIVVHGQAPNPGAAPDANRAARGRRR